MGFVNTECFREHGMYFEKYGRYPDGEEGSWEWNDYWEEEHRRVLEGYEVGGKKITGLHYLYLNYLPIRRIVEVKQTVHKNRATNARKVGVKDEKLPDFWDEDYVVFWLWEIAKNGISRAELKKLDLGVSLVEDDSNLSGGHHFLWVKPRGAGASWKGAVVPARNQFFINNNNTFILADTEQYLLKDGIFEKYVSYMSSLNKTTGFSRLFSKTGNDKMEYRASYWEKNESGVLIEKGKKSSVYGVILDGDVNKARGKRGDALFEEFGSFPKVDKAWEVYQSSVEEDGVVYGTMYGFGTGGDDTSDGIVALTKMFQDPKPYNILELHNKWDEGFYDFPCAHFTPAYRSITFKDAAGNSLEDEGKAYFDAIREDKKRAKDPTVLPNHCAEKPYNPQEALMKLKQNIFPVQDLRKHLNYIRASGMAKAIILKGTLSYGEKGVNFQLNDKLQALTSYPIREEDKTGCWCVVNKPFTVGGVVPTNMYRIAVDPYRHDTTTGVSVGACYVVENPNGHTGGMGDRIVAWYVGRPTLQDTFNENIYKAAVYWNAKIGFENDEPGGLIDYGKTHNSPFTGKKLLSYLEEQFELAYDEKMATRSTMKRSFGMHMGSGKTNLRKLQGDKYIQEWLLKPRGMNENGESVYNYQLIYDEGLLEEMCAYGDGNFDRISAFRIAMYHEREFEYKQRKILTVPIVNSFFSRQLYQ